MYKSQESKLGKQRKFLYSRQPTSKNSLTNSKDPRQQQNQYSQYYEQNKTIFKIITFHIVNYPSHWLLFLAILSIIIYTSNLIIKPPSHEFCIVTVKQRTNVQQFEQFVGGLMQQNFKDWKMFYYTQQYNVSQKQKITSSQDFLNRITIKQSMNNIGKDFYDGVNNQCSQGSVVIILQDGQKFKDSTSLNKIVQKFETDIHTYLLASDIEINGTIFHANATLINNFSRSRHYSQDIPQKQQEQVYKNISIHVKAFKSDFYKIIMPFDILTLDQKFYENKISYLFPLLQIKSTQCNEVCMKPRSSFRIDYFAQMPDRIVVVPEVLFQSKISVPIFDEEAEQITRKMSYSNIERIFDFVQALNMDKPKYWPTIFTDKKINLLKRNIIKGKYEIPKKIHQIWVGNNSMSPLKQKLSQKLKKVYQGYQYRLWTNKDITRQNFPKTYDIIMQIIEIDKTFQYSRMSMVSDFMRWEIIYNHGGFYFDTNYQAIKTYQQFRHYPFISNCESVSECLYFYVASPFGAPKGSHILARLLDEKNMSKINLRGNSAIESGPGYFSKGVTTEQFYYDIKMLPANIANPYMIWTKDMRFAECKCRFQKEIPSQLQGLYEETIEVKGQLTVFPCDIFYPNAYGVDHYYTGTSWKDKKSKKQK